MTRQRQELGKLGEDLACRELESRGHEIVERRYRTDRGELDIISTHSGVVVFVEVRTKSGEDYGDGAESITPQKQQQLVWMATDYVTRKRLENIPCRFDVVSIETTVNPPRVTVFEDAFRPGW
jgi:putative endonuclease